MTVLVTYPLTGVDGKACMAGKESNTKSLTRSIGMIVEITTTVMMIKVLMVIVLIVRALMMKVSFKQFSDRFKLNSYYVVKVKVKSAYKLNGPPDRSLSRFLLHEATGNISTPRWMGC